MTTTPYIGQALPSKIVVVSSTNLFRVAYDELGDAFQASRIADLNNMSDYWILEPVTLLIPARTSSTVKVSP